MSDICISMNSPQLRPTDDLGTSRCVRVCQNRSCRKQGSAHVLSAFQSHQVAGVTVVGSSCLGQCGNGPMVMVSPDQVWYNRVQPTEVPAIVERHLRGGHPVAGMLYRRFHQHQ